MIIRKQRKTKETEITCILSMQSSENPGPIHSSLPFFDHLLTAMSFHGDFSLQLQGKGDIEIDPHHLVEDTGLVLGDAFAELASESGPLKRFAHSVIPMDDALAEVTVDVSGRPYLVYTAEYPQPLSGTFSMSLLQEFFYAFVHRGGVTLHAEVRYGSNSHHMAEALFKALGKALKTAYTPAKGKNQVLSTKGII